MLCTIKCKRAIDWRDDRESFYVIIEEAPLPGSNFAFLYRDDGQGAGSNNTGFFAHFRQGRLDQGDFNISKPSANQVVAIDAISEDVAVNDVIVLFVVSIERTFPEAT